MKKGLLLILLLVLLGCGPAPAPTALPIPPTAPPTAAAALPTSTPIVSTAIPAPTPKPTPPPTAIRPTVIPTYTGPQPPASAALGDTWLRPADGMIMVYVPGGTFPMGSDPSDSLARRDEFPQHMVTVESFWIDQTEVTNAQFLGYLNEKGNTRAGGGTAVKFGSGYLRIQQAGDQYTVPAAAANDPLVMVSWYGAAAYCEWVGGRLPTEAEWEYAARGPQGFLYPWGNDPPNCQLANYGDCHRYTAPVGSRPDGTSWCGALDMAGNVWEWVQDWYEPYPATAQIDPLVPSSGDFPVMRGGGWHSPPWEVRATDRQHNTAASSVNG